MLLKRHFERLLLSPSDLEAAARRFRGRRGFQSRRDRRRWRGHPAGARGGAARAKHARASRRCRAGRPARAW